MSEQLNKMPCICCNLPTEYEDIEDKLVIRGSHHKNWCDFYREINCIECGIVVSNFNENNHYTYHHGNYCFH